MKVTSARNAGHALTIWNVNSAVFARNVRLIITVNMICALKARTGMNTYVRIVVTVLNRIHSVSGADYVKTAQRIIIVRIIFVRIAGNMT